VFKFLSEEDLLVNKQLKGFVAGFATAAVLMGGTIFADGLKKMIEVEFDAIHIKVNGNDVSASNILYEGTTYVPLRAISEMLGMDVIWDGATSTAHINDKGYIANPDMEIATINGEKITFEEFKVHFNLIKNQMQAYGGQVDVEGAKKMALESVIQDKIQVQKAASMSITLSSDDQKEIEEQKNYYMNVWGGKEGYEETLKEIGFSEQSFDKFLKDQMLVNKLYNKITGIDSADVVTEKKIEEYYNKNIDIFKQAKAKHILISTVDGQGNPLPEDKQEEARKKAEDIYKRIKDGEDFDKLMNEYSEDPGLASYPDGYDVVKGQMVQEFEDAVFSMKKGDVSSPVKTIYGYHIIKVEEELHALPIEEVKEQIKAEILREQKAAQQLEYQRQIEQWRNEAAIEINETALNSIKLN